MDLSPTQHATLRCIREALEPNQTEAGLAYLAGLLVNPTSNPARIARAIRNELGPFFYPNARTIRALADEITAAVAEATATEPEPPAPRDFPAEAHAALGYLDAHAAKMAPEAARLMREAHALATRALALEANPPAPTIPCPQAPGLYILDGETIRVGPVGNATMAQKSLGFSWCPLRGRWEPWARYLGKPGAQGWARKLNEGGLVKDPSIIRTAADQYTLSEWLAGGHRPAILEDQGLPELASKVTNRAAGATGLLVATRVIIAQGLVLPVPVACAAARLELGSLGPWGARANQAMEYLAAIDQGEAVRGLTVEAVRDVIAATAAEVR